MDPVVTVLQVFVRVDRKIQLSLLQDGAVARLGAPGGMKPYNSMGPPERIVNHQCSIDYELKPYECS